MKKAALALITILSFIIMSCGEKPAEDNKPVKNKFELNSCTGNELINANTSEEELMENFGKENVSRQQRSYAEGTETYDVTILYAGTPNEMVVKWKEDSLYQKPEWLEFYSEGSEWTLEKGIKIGTPLDTLVKLNGGDFSFMGFDWDYGGYAQFEGGRLETFCAGIRLYYNSGEKEVPFEEISGIIGDTSVKTNHPALEKVNVYVSGITIKF